MFLQIGPDIEPVRAVEAGHFVGDSVDEAHVVFESGDGGVAFTAVGAVAGPGVAGAPTPRLTASRGGDTGQGAGQGGRQHTCTRHTHGYKRINTTHPQHQAHKEAPRYLDLALFSAFHVNIKYISIH